MLRSIIYSDIIVVFKAGVQNGARILAEVDNVWNASVAMHDSLIVVSFWPETDTSHPDKPKNINKGLKEVKDILKSYGVDYKIKKFTF